MRSKMRKLLALVLSVSLALSGCGIQGTGSQGTDEQAAQSQAQGQTEQEPSYSSLNDPDFLDDVEDAAYESVVEELAEQGYYLENIQVAYLSKEFIDELSYNSKENVFFGYSLSELDEQFEGERYAFYPNDLGETDVKAFEAYDDTYDVALRDVAVGTGVILVCVTVSAATGGAAPAVSMIFAVSAKAGTLGAVTGAAFGGASAGILTALKTGDSEAATKAFVSSAADGFKWGAISGALSGGLTEGMGLRGAARNGLTMNEAAIIQRDSKMPLDVIKNLHNMDEYQVYKDAGLAVKKVNGSRALAQDIDIDYVDADGHTNLWRMQHGEAPKDASGVSYELHHVGQKDDSPLAVLTQSEHRLGDNYSKLHVTGTEGVDHGSAWAKTTKAFWKALAESYA